MNETAVEAISEKLAEVALLAEELDKVLQTNDVIKSEDKGSEISVRFRRNYNYCVIYYLKMIVLQSTSFNAIILTSNGRFAFAAYTYIKVFDSIYPFLSTLG